MRRCVRSACVFLLAACGGGDPSGPGGGGGVTNFTAKIDGVAWAPDFSPMAVNAAAGLYSITAFKSTGSNPYTIVLSLANITGTGTYPLGVTPQIFGGSAQVSDLSSGWATPNTGQDGTLVITTLTATQIVGTFSFVATPILTATGNKTVTEGQFDIPVTGTAGLAAANQGSSVTGTFGGASFVGATGLALLTSGTLTIVSNSPGRTITISITNMTGAATYALAGTRVIQVGDGLGAAWTSNTTGGSGSVTITSATSGRIVGTFTGTVVGVLGGASGPMAISGSFSMGGSF